jgi:hypothetical protein
MHTRGSCALGPTRWRNHKPYNVQSLPNGAPSETLSSRHGTWRIELLPVQKRLGLRSMAWKCNYGFDRKLDWWGLLMTICTYSKVTAARGGGCCTTHGARRVLWHASFLVERGSATAVRGFLLRGKLSATPSARQDVPGFVTCCSLWQLTCPRTCFRQLDLLPTVHYHMECFHFKWMDTC